MTSSLLQRSAAWLASSVLFIVPFAACSPSGDEVEAASTASQTEAVRPLANRECVIDTIMVKPGLLRDFRASVGDAFYKEFTPPAYPHVQIPGVFDAAISPVAESGEWFYTVVGFDYHPETLPAGSTDTPRTVATLSAHPVRDDLLVTAKKNYASVKAIFLAMTKARQTFEQHVAAPGTFDQSWIKTTHASPEGRIVCTATTFPDTGEMFPTYECTFTDVKSNMVQIFSTGETSGRCLAE